MHAWEARLECCQVAVLNCSASTLVTLRGPIDASGGKQGGPLDSWHGSPGSGAPPWRLLLWCRIEHDVCQPTQAIVGGRMAKWFPRRRVL